MKKALTTILLFVSLSIISTECKAQLSAADRDSLTKHLNILSISWVGTSVEKANTILTKSNYTWQDWTTYFSNYYKNYPITTELRIYLGYPAVSWFDNNVHFKLQQAIKYSAIEQLDSIFGIQNLGQVLSTNPILKEEVSNFSQFFDDITSPTYTALPDSALSRADTLLAEMISRRPLLKRNQNIPPATQPFVAHLALKLHSILLKFKPLDAQRIDYISTKLELPSAYKNLLLRHSLFVGDNNKMSVADLNYLDTILTNFPKSIHQLRILTNNDYLYSIGQQPISIGLYLRAVNVFSTVGGFQENGFPNDITGFTTDGFTNVVGHELTHCVDPDYIYKDSVFYPRRRQLVAQAGTVDLQYLRSWNGAGVFFQSNPQEFIASISNQYLANTERTLELGIKRFNAGYKEPINQFLYFAEIQSERGSTTRFYLNNTQAQLKTTVVPVIRNASNNISEFNFNCKNYKFSLDQAGNVTKIDTTNLITPFTALIAVTNTTYPTTLFVQNPVSGSTYTLFKDNISTGLTGSTFNITQAGNYYVTASAAAGCWSPTTTTSNSIFFSVATAIFDPVNRGSQIKTFPNPTGGVFYISSLRKGYTVCVTNIRGQVILKTTLASDTNTYQFNISSSSKGIYQLEIFDQKGQFLGREILVKN